MTVPRSGRGLEKPESPAGISQMDEVAKLTRRSSSCRQLDWPGPWEIAAALPATHVWLRMLPPSRLMCAFSSPNSSRRPEDRVTSESNSSLAKITGLSGPTICCLASAGTPAVTGPPRAN